MLEFLNYNFMVNALLAILLLSPMYALLGTMVVDSKMSFFSEALGHSALTGVAIGVALGFGDPVVATVIFGVLFALGINQVKKRGRASSDTIISVFSSAAISLGLVLLSKGGNFAKYSSLLVGDIMSVTKSEIFTLLCAMVVIFAVWVPLFNRLMLVGVNRSLAKSRNINVALVENVFMVMVAVLVTLSITRVGALIINSMLVLPAASSRNLARSTAQYHAISAVIGLVCGVCGLVLSFYLNTTAGATIVLLMAAVYFISLLFTKK